MNGDIFDFMENKEKVERVERGEDGLVDFSA